MNFTLIFCKICLCVVSPCTIFFFYKSFTGIVFGICPAFPSKIKWSVPYHFQVTILETGNIRWPGIGVVDKKYNMSYMPGWDNESVGYHTDDGKIYHNDDYDGKETKGF